MTRKHTITTEPDVFHRTLERAIALAKEQGGYSVGLSVERAEQGIVAPCIAQDAGAREDFGPFLYVLCAPPDSMAWAVSTPQTTVFDARDGSRWDFTDEPATHTVTITDDTNEIRVGGRVFRATDKETT